MYPKNQKTPDLDNRYCFHESILEIQIKKSKKWMQVNTLRGMRIAGVTGRRPCRFIIEIYFRELNPQYFCDMFMPTVDLINANACSTITTITVNLIVIMDAGDSLPWLCFGHCSRLLTLHFHHCFHDHYHRHHHHHQLHQAALLSSSPSSTPLMATQKLGIQLLRSERGEKKRC